MHRLAADAESLLTIALTQEQVDQFDLFLRELVAWNAHTNLTAIIDPDGVRVRHFLDSLTVAKVIPLEAGVRVIDVGTGAGFPGIPLKIVYPQLEVTLLEATGKKVNFLRHVAQVLGLSGIHFVNARAEEAGQMPEHRAAYDVVVARAVARMPILMEYLLPLTKVGGLSIAMKGVTAHEETATAKRALSTFGGQLRSIETFQLPNVEEPHNLVVVNKTATTPALYPRYPGLPTQKPIR